VATIIVVGGCGPKIEKPVRICPGKQNVLYSLSSLKSHAENAVPIKANGKCRLQFYVNNKPKPHKEEFPIKVWFSPPCHVRLQGDVAFDAKGIVVGSNQEEFWLWIRPEISSYWWGKWSEQDSAEKVNINPTLVLEAFGTVEPGFGENWSLSNEGAFDVLTRRDNKGRIVKKIYVYNCDYLVRRIEFYDTEGVIAVAAELENYRQVVEGFSVPAFIRIVKHAEGKKEDSVRIHLGSVKSAAFTEEQRKGLFSRREPGRFEHVFRIVEGKPVEWPQ
jgi:hypothetical protein